ncbi:hypothetical protein BH23ACT4_BH23ACT4_12380 [soil metagenome]
MRELTVRAVAHNARLDGDDTFAAVANLAAEIQTPGCTNS